MKIALKNLYELLMSCIPQFLQEIPAEKKKNISFLSFFLKNKNIYAIFMAFSLNFLPP